MTARQELDAARPVVAQLDASRGAERTKADLVAVWSAVEAALRSLVGSSAAGQTLIRDARSRQLLSFDQANALVSFLSVREALDRPDYAPTDVDANTARTAFLKLDAGLMSAPAPTPVFAAPAAVPATTPASDATQPPAAGRQPFMRSRSRVWIPIVAAVVVVGIVALVLFMRRGPSTQDLNDGIRAYQAGDKQTAANEFEMAARAMPNSALPHVYLSRMAREVGNYTVANQELQLALRAEPNSLEGRREYGSLFLAQGNYEMARTWYVNALKVSPTDKTSQGWLGCAMAKLNRLQEAQQWMTRAGSGPWSSCMPAAQMPVAPPS
jgi:tetratricopeptide (TPR) repeat protein